MRVQLAHQLRPLEGAQVDYFDYRHECSVMRDFEPREAQRDDDERVKRAAHVENTGPEEARADFIAQRAQLARAIGAQRARA